MSICLYINKQNNSANMILLLLTEVRRGTSGGLHNKKTTSRNLQGWVWVRNVKVTKE